MRLSEMRCIESKLRRCSPDVADPRLFPRACSLALVAASFSTFELSEPITVEVSRGV